MEFGHFRNLLINNFANMTKDATHLFEVALDKDDLWNLYLDSFPPGTNPIYRTRREFDCGCCRHFIKNIGAVVVLKDNETKSIWDFDAGDAMYQPVIDALSTFVKSKPITDVYISDTARVGTRLTRDLAGDGLIEWHHFFLDLPEKFQLRRGTLKSAFIAGFRDSKAVFKRSLDELKEDSVLTVLELISQKSLYKGDEWKAQLEAFLDLKRKYDRVPPEKKDAFAWEQSVKAGPVISRIRNHSIGTLLIDISEGMELDSAVRKYEAIVAPSNYKRPKAVFTQRMLDSAKAKIAELGYMDSLKRAFATVDDITVNDLLYSNRDVAKRMEVSDDVFGSMAKSIPMNPKKFSRVEEVPVETFVASVLPTVSEMEVLFEGAHTSNLVSLIAPAKKEAPSMFKWANGFGWAYTGNITDSDMRERVKSAGGKVDGVLRFSIQWNDQGEDICDLDAHCIEPSRNEIYFSNKRNISTGGNLDVDIICPTHGKPAVENITWPVKAKMLPGAYKFFVRPYSGRAKNGFRAEVEFDGQIFSFDYSNSVYNRDIPVATVTLDKDGKFTISEDLPSSTSSRELWGLKVNQFVPVSAVMWSPNHWEGQSGVGHKHLFFMLKGCVNPEQPNGFYNEFLKEELMEHRHVLEALGEKMAVVSSDDQLSGVGFSTTKRNSVTVRVKGSTERVLNIIF